MLIFKQNKYYTVTYEPDLKIVNNFMCIFVFVFYLTARTNAAPVVHRPIPRGGRSGGAGVTGLAVDGVSHVSERTLERDGLPERC